MSIISIVTPLFNKGRYIRETLESVLAQSEINWELIVVNNGSTDDGPEIVRYYAEKDRRIRIFTCDKQGPGAARNHGLNYATGDWILFLDADDLIRPEYLASRLSLVAQSNCFDLIVGCWEEFSEEEGTKVLRRPTGFGGAVKALEDSAITFAPWALHACLIKRSRINPDLYWPEALDGLPSEDTAFWFSIICDSSIAWSDNAGALYRVRTETSRNEIRDPEKWVQAVMGVIEHNVTFLRSRGQSLTTKQCANIVRVLESNYRMALAHHSKSGAAVALKQADSWLATCPANDFSFRVRKLLGLRLFNLLRYGVV